MAFVRLKYHVDFDGEGGRTDYDRRMESEKNILWPIPVLRKSRFQFQLTSATSARCRKFNANWLAMLSAETCSICPISGNAGNAGNASGSHFEWVPNDNLPTLASIGGTAVNHGSWRQQLRVLARSITVQDDGVISKTYLHGPTPNDCLCWSLLFSKMTVESSTTCGFVFIGGHVLAISSSTESEGPRQYWI